MREFHSINQYQMLTRGEEGKKIRNFCGCHAYNSPVSQGGVSGKIDCADKLYSKVLPGHVLPRDSHPQFANGVSRILKSRALIGK